MNNLNWIVTDVKADADYKLLLTFITGEKKVFNFMPLLDDKVNHPLKDINLFLKAKVHHHTVMWSEDIDISPEYLYENGIPVSQ